MQIDDLAQVHAIDVQSFSMPWPLSSYRYELLENPASLQWVAEACSPDGTCQVVGMIVVWLILDEAHNCAPSGRGKYATDSLRTQALRVMVPHF